MMLLTHQDMVAVKTEASKRRAKWRNRGTLLTAAPGATFTCSRKRTYRVAKDGSFRRIA